FAFPQERLSADAPGSFLNRFEKWSAGQRVAPIDSSLPFTGGGLVFAGYELARGIGAVLDLAPAPGPNAAFALRIPAALIYDHDEERMHLIIEGGREDLIGQLQADVSERTEARERSDEHALRLRIREEEPGRFLQGVLSVKDYIRAGDVYQVN